MQLKCYIGANGRWTPCELFDAPGLNEMLDELMDDDPKINNPNPGFYTFTFSIENSGRGYLTEPSDDSSYLVIESIIAFRP